MSSFRLRGKTGSLDYKKVGTGGWLRDPDVDVNLIGLILFKSGAVSVDLKFQMNVVGDKL